ncbi:cytochrome P450 oxidoreductase-like protein [Paraphaeosphaeria sporulosa]|uniref:Cytochrome P450 oxidoreductase-like protein n=1 Tax=Paraphaeosphaeria sporulosa TaxID=1460663 RepID=A0A177CAN9_9PLEO|nr:cytochrome P450 oxidoreductase-like protein [Paraphaeosphaeria sporulosa]OAG03879.1 cytochrome P450 oxidoreductase-like protein [Paraphaeosphaeria sporulosa]
MGRPVGYTFGLAALVVTAFCIRFLYKFGSRDKRLPPGPPTIPILGNAHQIPGQSVEKKFKEWADIYGPIYSLKIGAGTLIMLNDKRTVHDLLDKRSAIYSERPKDQQMMTALAENFAFWDANPAWRASRKIAAHFVSPKNLDETVMAVQEAEASQLMHDLLNTPEDFFNHVKRVTASVASIVIFGFRAPTPDSFWATVSSTPGTYLPIEQFPILNYIPSFLVPSKKRAKTCFDTVSSIWVEAHSQVVARRQKGDHRVSLGDRLISGEMKSDVEMSPRQEANFIGTLHQGAADTTSTMVLTNILYLAKHPWIQKKAQEELDRVCGDHRAPTWDDFKNLPYINCIVKESMRMRPVLPTGVPVRVNRDDWFDGYLIPKDSAVFCPAYNIHMNADLYPDPHNYNPDRYLNRPLLAMSYAGSPDYENRDHYSYGAGRRICVGIHLAERTLWRLTARLLWAYSIKPELDEKGNELEIDTDAYDDGLLCCPKPFNVRFVPRSEKHVEVIKKDFEAVEDYLKTWE